MKLTKKIDRLNSKIIESDDGKPKKIKRNLGERSKSATPSAAPKTVGLTKKTSYVILPIGL